LLALYRSEVVGDSANGLKGKWSEHKLTHRATLNEKRIAWRVHIENEEIAKLANNVWVLHSVNGVRCA
jgi:hypothetical protein